MTYDAFSNGQVNNTFLIVGLATNECVGEELSCSLKLAKKVRKQSCQSTCHNIIASKQLERV